jgi:predicted nucleic acid-binding Zn ribbon protein
MTDNSEAIAVYLRFRELFGGRTTRPVDRKRRDRKIAGEAVSEPFGAGRDPRGLGAVMDSLTADLGWKPQLAQSELLARWAEIAGAETAAHTAIETISDGVLVVRCESSAWAASLRLMGNLLVGEISGRFPDAGVQSIRFIGPDAPSWKRGSRSIPGRGPRDTYG